MILFDLVSFTAKLAIVGGTWRLVSHHLVNSGSPRAAQFGSAMMYIY